MFLFSLKRYCPECHSRDVRKSARWGIIESRILPLLFWRPYRCERCDTRFLGLVFAKRIKGKNRITTSRSGSQLFRECSGRKKSEPGSIGKTLDCMHACELGGSDLIEQTPNREFTLTGGILSR